MGWRLRPDLSFCVAQGRIIFLDLGRDRFFRLRAREEVAFRQLVEGSQPTAGALGALIEDGLVCEAPGDARPKPVTARHFAPQPAPTDASAAGVIEIGRAFAGQFRAGWMVRHRPLHGIVAGLRSVARPPVPVADAAPIIAAHRAADLWLTRHDQCLSKSVALLWALRRKGISAVLVFGVAARPFAAHCWVESEGEVLNDDVEHARLFQPILVV